MIPASKDAVRKLNTYSPTTKGSLQVKKLEKVHKDKFEPKEEWLVKTRREVSKR